MKWIGILRPCFRTRFSNTCKSPHSALDAGCPLRPPRPVEHGVRTTPPTVLDAGVCGARGADAITETAAIVNTANVTVDWTRMRVLSTKTDRMRCDPAVCCRHASPRPLHRLRHCGFFDRACQIAGGASAAAGPAGSAQ